MGDFFALFFFWELHVCIALLMLSTTALYNMALLRGILHFYCCCSWAGTSICWCRSRTPAPLLKPPICKMFIIGSHITGTCVSGFSGTIQTSAILWFLILLVKVMFERNALRSESLNIETKDFSDRYLDFFGSNIIKKDEKSPGTGNSWDRDVMLWYGIALWISCNGEMKIWI